MYSRIDVYSLWIFAYNGSCSHWTLEYRIVRCIVLVLYVFKMHFIEMSFGKPMSSANCTWIQILVVYAESQTKHKCVSRILASTLFSYQMKSEPNTFFQSFTVLVYHIIMVCDVHSHSQNWQFPPN